MTGRHSSAGRAPRLANETLHHCLQDSDEDQPPRERT